MAGWQSQPAPLIFMSSGEFGDRTCHVFVGKFFGQTTQCIA